MIKGTHRRLTYLYTLLIVIFLICFVLISYFLVSLNIYNKQKSIINSQLLQETAYHQADLLDWYNGRNLDAPAGIGYRPDLSVFYYVVGYDGQLLLGNETLPHLRSDLFNRIDELNFHDEDVHFQKIKHGDENYYLAISGKDLYIDENYIGSVYVGTDMTEKRKMLDQILIVLIILAILFIGGSSLIGYYMAGRAMVPISNTFKRQREFIADASHELRTPLSILQSSLEVLEAEDGKKLSAHSQQIIDDMKNVINRMAKLVNELLTLARFDSSEFTINKQSYDLQEDIQHIIRSFQSVLEKHSLHFHVDIPDRLTVFADREKIAQLLSILLDNAIKFTPASGQVSLTVLQLDDGMEKSVQITVEDTGIGMSTEDQKRIFDRFYQIDKGRSPNNGGAGLGLPIAYWIVKAHGGSIDVESTLDQGSTFTVLLPILHFERENQ